MPDPSSFIVTYNSIIPNLTSLRGYEPLMAHFFARAYRFESTTTNATYRLIDRSGSLGKEIRWEEFSRLRSLRLLPGGIFRESHRTEQAYFDSMTHFDFKCLLPALLHVEDRMSMAHGLESRTPSLDHPLVEFAATVPADIKFHNGHMKHLLSTAFAGSMPRES